MALPSEQARFANVRLQIAALSAVVMLSFDFLNPVKHICSIIKIPTEFVGLITAISTAYLIAANLSDVFYFMVKIFFQSILSIFFSSVEVIGIDNIPINGPILFTGNHNNQFVDAVVLISCLGPRVGFLIAEKSWNKPVIGFFSRLSGAVPVARPQDSAVKGHGKIIVEGTVIKGVGTRFTAQLKNLDKIRPEGCTDSHKIKTIISDTELELDEELPVMERKSGQISYDIHKYINQKDLFNKVHHALAKGQCIGIFPEGGSHDRTDLLPLKAGIAVIAFGALESYNVSVPIVPVGLNYFRGHRFRGRVVVEIGAPIRLTEKLYHTYRTNKKEAFSQLLTEVEDGMRAVIVTAPSYEVLQLVYVARRLYQRTERKLSAQDRQDMNRRFAEGYKILQAKYEGREPPEFAEMRHKLTEYSRTLQQWNLRDYQVTTFNVQISKLFYSFMHMLFVFVLASIPAIFLNLPVGLLARTIAESERQKALKSSSVKVAARDVVLSKKIIICIIAVPLLWILYAILLFAFTDLKLNVVLLIFFSMPLFSYYGVMAAEQGMIDWKDIKPAFLRLLPSARHEVQQLPQKRAQLQKEVRAFVRRYGPECGEIYNEKIVRWDVMVRRTQSFDNLTTFAAQMASSSPGNVPTPSDVSPATSSQQLCQQQDASPVTVSPTMQYYEQSDSDVRIENGNPNMNMPQPLAIDPILKKNN